MSFNDGLIPAKFITDIIEVNKTKSPQKAFELLERFPQVNRYTLFYMCRLWNEIAAFKSVNKMKIENICVCVCPSLIHINEYDY